MTTQARRLAQGAAMIGALVFLLFVAAAVMGGEWDYVIVDGTIAVVLARWAVSDAGEG